MQLRRLDDYQGWQVLHGGTSVLLDPWLTDDPITGSFDRQQSASAITLEQLRSEPCAVGAIALCTSVSDHARPHTLAALAEVPVVGPARATRVARRAGSRDVRALRPGMTHVVDCPGGGSLRITATRTGYPLRVIAVGYLLEGVDSAGASCGRVWLEPHKPTASVARSLAPVDIALLPCESVTAVVLPVNAGPEVSARAAQLADARVLVPTATDPGRDMTAWQRSMYRVRGGIDQAAHAADVVALRAGEVLEVRS